LRYCRGLNLLQLTHIKDLVEIIRRVIPRMADGVFNVGAENALTASQMMARLHNYSLTVPYPILRPLGAVAWKTRLSFTDGGASRSNPTAASSLASAD
jgi:nucleoside-diphosphate-sugar epimerase